MSEKSEQPIERDDLHTVAARAEARRSLEADIAAFLAQGGTIQDVADDSAADASPHAGPHP